MWKIRVYFTPTGEFIDLAEVSNPVKPSNNDFIKMPDGSSSMVMRVSIDYKNQTMLIYVK